MANNNKKKNSNRSISYGSLFGLIALVAVMLLALAFMVSFIFGWIDAVRSVAGIITKIATAIALIITIAASYPAARRRGKTWFILWLVAAIIVFAAYILGISFKLF